MDLSLRIGDAVCGHVCSRSEWASLVEAGQRSGTFDAMPDEFQQLLQAIERRPTRDERWHELDDAGLTAAGIEVFHLPGRHDQKSHGNWARGGSRRYGGPQWQLPDSITQQQFDRLRRAAGLHTAVSRGFEVYDGADPDDTRLKVLDARKAFEAARPWPEAQIAMFRAMHEGEVLGSLYEWAHENGHGKPDEKLMKQLAEQTRQAFEGKKIGVRVTDAQLGRILERGRFSTQFESRRSKGLTDQQIRANAEAVSFGLAASTPEEQRASVGVETRPVYGMVMVDGIRPAGIGSADMFQPGTDALSQYGRTQVVLKEDVRTRTTAMFGDSLNNRHNGMPSPVNDPTWESWTPSWKSMVGTALAGPDRPVDSSEFRRNAYAEAQIHGGVAVSDIEEVVFAATPAAALRKQLDDAGVKWRVHNWKTAAKSPDATERANALRIAEQDRQYLTAEIADLTEKHQAALDRGDQYSAKQYAKEIALLQKQLNDVTAALPSLQDAAGVVASGMTVIAAGGPADGQLVATREDGAQLVTAGGEAAMLMSSEGTWLTSQTAALGRGDWTVLDEPKTVQVPADQLAHVRKFDAELSAGDDTVTASGQFHLPGQHDQRTHGRRGRPHADPLTPTTSPTGPGADQAGRWHRDLDDLAGLVDAFGGGILSTTRIPGGRGQTVSLIQFASGHDGLQLDFTAAGMPDDPAADPVRRADSEMLSSMLGRAIGSPVSRALRVGETTVITDRVPGRTGAETMATALQERGLDKRVARLATIRQHVAGSKNAARLGAIDVLTGNESRGSSTWVVLPTNGQPASVQMPAGWTPEALRLDGFVPPGSGAAVAGKKPRKKTVPHKRVSKTGKEFWVGLAPGEEPPKSPPPEPTDPFEIRFADAYGRDGQWVDNPLTEQDVAWLRQQLDDLRDDFQAVERGDWWQFSSDRLDAIATHARGTENLFAPVVAGGFSAADAPQYWDWPMQIGPTDPPDRAAFEAQGGPGRAKLDELCDCKSELFHLPGQHNQKTHGRERSLPGQWLEETDPLKISTYVQQHVNQRLGRTAKAQPSPAAAALYSGYTLATTPNGGHQILFRPGTSEADRDRVIGQIERLHATWPVSRPVQINVLAKPISQDGKPVHGLSMPGGLMTLAQSVVEGKIGDSIEHLMPSAQTAPTEYVLAHEWGHQLMFDQDLEAQASRFWADGDWHLSGYASDDEEGHEAMAEAFADWVEGPASDETVEWAMEFGWDRE